MAHARRLAAFVALLIALSAPASALASSKKATPTPKPTPTPKATSALRASPNPSPRAYDAATDVATLTEDQLIGQSAILIDADTGKVLFQKDPHRRMLPASTTKILTTLLALENGDLDDEITAPKDVMSVEPTIIQIRPGERMSLRDALYGVMLCSYNDLAYSVAVHISGSTKGFATLMNERAKQIGCTESHFVTPHGLPNPDHYTTVSDMAKIASVAIQNPTFRTIMSTHEHRMPPLQNLPDGLLVTNKNAMLPDSGTAQFAYPYSIGIKTGFTNDAAHTYVGAATKDGVTLIACVFGTTSDGKWTDTAKLFDYGFATYNKVDLSALLTQQVFEKQVEGASPDDAQNGVVRLVLKDPSDPKLQTIRDTKDAAAAFASSIAEHVQVAMLVDELRAPVVAGSELAQLTVTVPGHDPITVPLVAERDVAARQNALASMFGGASASGSGGAQEAINLDTTGFTAGANDADKPFPWMTVIPIALGALLLFWLAGQHRKPKRRRRRSVAHKYYTAHYGLPPRSGTGRGR